jgi:hypothetical protein
VSESNAYRYQKTPGELREALERQIRHLRRSNETYDKGDVEEAERIAAALYVLFADYASNKALTKLTGIRGKLRFPDSRHDQGPKVRPQEVWVGPPLCSVGDKGSYVPALAGGKTDHYPQVQYHRWWQTAVFATETGRQLTRKNLVFALGNQDGGRHVDKTLRDEAYHWLKEQGDIHIRDLAEDADYVLFFNPKWAAPGGGDGSVNFRAFFHEGGSEASIGVSMMWPPPPDAKPLKNAHWATVRQMGWEADEAFKAAGF